MTDEVFLKIPSIKDQLNKKLKALRKRTVVISKKLAEEGYDHNLVSELNSTRVDIVYIENEIRRRQELKLKKEDEY